MFWIKQVREAEGQRLYEKFMSTKVGDSKHTKIVQTRLTVHGAWFFTADEPREDRKC